MIFSRLVHLAALKHATEFVEKRLMILAKHGHFEIDGDTTDMYSYQVKYVGE
ncbi:hypothetical protein ACQKNB_09930 [Lysinibacillus xylanilyticus]|uniref:hypothetical protein n=1 Tax=Lysinibacillus xylanilyticus TaxID=582475 RepID=UPI003CFBE36C